VCLLQMCVTCNLETLSANGNCVPGSFTIASGVTNDNGVTATAQRVLIVYQAAQMATSFALYLASPTAQQHSSWHRN